MKRILVCVATFFLAPGVAHAMPTPWELLNDNMDVVGTFLLDIDTQSTSDVAITGDLGVYTRSSTFTALNTSAYVGPYAVTNYFKFFSVEAGKVYRNDYGGGEYSEIRVNDSAMDIGTTGVLVPGGGLYAAYINEIYNYDEVNVYCGYYEELYDEEGNYIGDGPCVNYYQDAYFNTDAGYWYGGFYLRSQPVVADVPVPATALLLLAALCGLGIGRRRRR
ncbi:MAG: PEP-CTERM sorting domain-containing protein [Halioglobus sp.]|nr:PEP-CTERM sorting domain-containing protein [Halioglobus sp.]